MSMNKRAVSIPILILVLTAIGLSVLSLSYFIVKGNDINNVIKISNEIDEIYLKEQLLNFYLQDIFDKAAFGFNGDKKAFVDSFRRELLNYKDKNGLYSIGELAFVELKIIEDDFIDDVQVIGNSLILRMDLSIKNDLSNSNDIKLNYNYLRILRKPHLSKIF